MEIQAYFETRIHICEYFEDQSQEVLANVKHAKRLLEKLEILERDYFSSLSNLPTSITPESENDPLRIHIKIPMPAPEYLMLTADIVHNCRVGLDILACALARQNGESDKKVSFPFADKEENFEKAIKDKKFRRAGSDAVDILNKVKPYRGGNDLLRAIHDLDITYKHRLITPTAYRVGLPNPDFLVDENGKMHAASFKYIELCLLFPEDVPVFGGQEVLVALARCVNECESTIQAFLPLF